MANIVVAVVLLGIVAAAAAYVIRAKKQGQKCIGCPYAKQCSGSKGSCCSCGGTEP